MTDTVMSGKCKTPTGLYRVRCLDASFTEKNKSSGNPMVTLDCEIVAPEEVEHEGVTYRVAGQKFNIRLLCSPEKIGQVREFMDKLQVDHGGEFNSDEVKIYFRGCEWDMALSSTEQVKKYEPKPGQSVGDPILDGEGKPITNGWQIQAWPSDVPLNCRPNCVDLGPY